METWWQLNILSDSSGNDPVQSLSLFIHASDEDGEEDLDQIYLIHDDLYRFWSIPSDLWQSYSDQDIRWIGFNGLIAPGDGSFPEGNYRILLIDAGGERDETSFFLRNNIPDAESLQLPQIQFDQNTLNVYSDYPKFQLWFYDIDGNLIEKSKELLMGEYQWNNIIRNINKRASAYSLYTEPATGSWGLISGPFYFSD